MDIIQNWKRVLIVSAIVMATAVVVLNSNTINQESPKQSVHPSMNTPEPSKPFIWILGSTLAGLVGLKRFGLYRG